MCYVHCSGTLRAKVEKAEGYKKLLDLTEIQHGSNLQVCSIYGAIIHGMLI